MGWRDGGSRLIRLSSSFTEGSRVSADSSSNRVSALAISAIGVVFGDIGTSPLYALRETFVGHHPLPVTPEHVLGVLSLIFWAILLLISIKYVAIIMRADNHGEGGSLALLALVVDITKGSRLTWALGVLGIFAAALFFGDSMITPAISVLSAVEGLGVVAAGLESYVLPVTLLVLTGLFWIQKRGTATVGMLFGPVMVFWFGTIALFGIAEILAHPGVLQAVNPWYAAHFFALHPWESFIALGAVVLAVTGGEALYTDMGHFGKRPVRLAWFSLVMPALLCNYFGQGALLINDPAAIENPFYLLVPSYLTLPMVILATLATVIASQAVISGAFSVARQAILMGYLPRMQIKHTSGEERGQIYVPFINVTLYLGVMVLVLGFQSSSNLAAAYGIAVTGTMSIDTLLVTFVMLYLWRWSPLLVILVAGGLLCVDLAFFSANAIKIPQGGWFPLAMGLIVFTLLTTWKRGRAMIFAEIRKHSIPLELFLASLDASIPRVQGTSVFLTKDANGIPDALLHNLKHNKVLHDRVVLVTVSVAETPYVENDQRLRLQELGQGFCRLEIHYGFMESPDIPAAFVQCAAHGHEFDLMETSFYLSRETVIPSPKPGMALWREHLFAFMSRNATTATEFFHIPTNRVVELGTQLEI